MEIITSAADLVAGDVLYIAKLVEPRGKDPFWWRAYWIVEHPPKHARLVDCMLLKMHPDPDKDHRTFMFGEEPDKQVIQYLHPDEYPQGVQAMRTKAIMSGRIKIGGSG